jgi:hypothetical protein
VNGARRERAAYHEAGHAVAASCYHRRLRKVSIKGDHDADVRGYLARVAEIGEATGCGDKHLRIVTEGVTILLAGVAAERERTRTRRSGPAGGNDMHEALALAGRIIGDDELAPYMTWLVARTRRLITSRWAAIDALARELLVREEMTGAAAAALIRRATQPPAPSDDSARLAALLATVATR